MDEKKNGLENFVVTHIELMLSYMCLGGLGIYILFVCPTSENNDSLLIHSFSQTAYNFDRYLPECGHMINFIFTLRNDWAEHCANIHTINIKSTALPDSSVLSFV